MLTSREPLSASGFVKPNWTDWTVTGCLVCLPLTTFPFALRCYAKLKLHQRPWIEDWCCLVSWVFAVLDIAVTFQTVDLGLTQPARLLSPAQHDTLGKWIYALGLTHGPALLFTKLTLLVIMARLFSTQMPFALGIRLFICVIVVFIATTEVAKAVSCRPLRQSWAPHQQGRGQCLNLYALFLVDTLFAILVDAATLVIPVISAVPLRVSLFQKLKVIGMLGAGGVAVGVTIYRERLIVEYAHTKNYTQDLAKIMFYCRLEITIGQVCACLPFTNFLLQRKAKEGAMRRQTKRTRPTAHVWFGSIRTQDHTITSLGSTLTHSYPPKPPPSAGDTVAGGSSEGESLDGPPIPYPSRATRPAMEHAREASRPAFSPPVDEWSRRDVEEGRVGPGAAESPPSGPIGGPRTPRAVLVVPDRTAYPR